MCRACAKVREIYQDVVALLFALIAPAFIALSLMDDAPASAPKQTLGVFGVALAVLLTLIQAGLLIGYGHRYSRMETVSWPRVVEFVLLGVSTALWVVTLLSSVAFLYAGWTGESGLSTREVVSVQDVVAKFLWIGAKGVPLLDIADTVGWEDPVQKPGVVF